MSLGVVSTRSLNHGDARENKKECDRAKTASWVLFAPCISTLHSSGIRGLVYLPRAFKYIYLVLLCFAPSFVSGNEHDLIQALETTHGFTSV